MSLVDWRSLPVRVKRSRKRLYSVIAEEFSLDSWMELPIEIKRSKKKLYDFIANELNIDSFEELPVECRRSTRLMYTFIQENGGGGSTDTLTVVVTDGADPITDAVVTVDGDGKSTGSDGKATFTVEYGDYEAVISASGYTTKTEELKFRSNKKSFTITLEASGGGSTGTVTVTAVNSEQTLVSGIVVALCDTNSVPSQDDDSNIVAFGNTDPDGIGQLYVYDHETHDASDDPNISFGSYYLFAIDFNGTYQVYSSTLTVDGDETVTITLTTE